MGMASSLKTFVGADPVITAAVLLSVVGVALPVVVPPIRDSFSGTKPVPPPKLSEDIVAWRRKRRRVDHQNHALVHRWLRA